MQRYILLHNDNKLGLIFLDNNSNDMISPIYINVDNDTFSEMYVKADWLSDDPRNKKGKSSVFYLDSSKKKEFIRIIDFAQNN